MTLFEVGVDVGDPGRPITPQAVGNWERGVNEPKATHMQRLAKLLNLDFNELLSLRSDTPDDAGSDEAPISVDHNGEAITIPANGIREIDSAAGLGGGQVPNHVYSPSSTGMALSDAFKPDAWILPPRFVQSGLRGSPDQIIAITTQGDSMEPTIGNGDVVFVNTTHRRVSPPGLYAIRDVYGEIIVKRLDVFRAGDGLKLKITSDNPHEPARDEPIEEITVVGRVCGLFRTV